MRALICPTAPRATVVDVGVGLHVGAGPPAAVDADAGQRADVEHAVCANPSSSESRRSSVAVGFGRVCRVCLPEEPLRAPNAGFEGAAPATIRTGRSQEAGQGRRGRWHCHELRALCERASRGLGWCFCVRGVGIDPREHTFLMCARVVFNWHWKLYGSSMA